MSRSNLIFLAACGVLWALLYLMIAAQNRALVVEDRRQTGRAPLVRIRPAGQLEQSLPVKVLLIHGLSGSKSAMKQMAGELARWGCDCYLVDLPGHGDSRENFSLEATVSAIDRVVLELLSVSNDADHSSTPLVVIGHSFGARVALGAAERHPRIAAVIALSPAAESFAPKQVPLLIVTGEFDFPFVRRGAAFLYEQVTGARLPRLDEPGQWQSSTGSSRLVVLPWTDHSQTLFRAGSLKEIRSWLTRVSPEITKVSFSPGSFWARAQFRVLFCLLSLLIWFPLIALLADLLMPARREYSRNSFVSSKGGFGVVWIYAFAAALAILFLTRVNPWERLGLLGGDYLTGLLCATGMVGLAALRPNWKSADKEWRAILCSLFAWLILVLGCSPWITPEFVHLDLSATRFWRLPWISLSVLPFFVFDEALSRRSLQGLGTARIVMFHLSTRFILAIALLLGFFVLRNGQFLVVLILPGLLLTSLICWCLAAWIHQNTGSVAASGLFGALATGWFFSVFFTQL